MLGPRISRTGPSSLKRFPGGRFFGRAFVLGCRGPAQDTTRKIVKNMTVQYPALLQNKGMRRNSRVKPCLSSLTAR